MLVVTLMSMTLLTALATTVLLATMTETAISASYREAAQAFYAAEAAAYYAMQDLSADPDWRVMLSEQAMSALVDGPPSGTRAVGGTILDLTRANQDANALARDVGDPNRSPWNLYAFGRFEDMLAFRRIGIPMYVVIWVAGPSEEPDKNGPESSGRDVLAILSQAYGPGGSRRTVELTIARSTLSPEENPAPTEVLSWRELR